MFQIVDLETVPATLECIQTGRNFGMTPRTTTSDTRGDKRRLSQSKIIVEDISDISACPKCAGILKWGKDIRYEDAVACVYCGWRPSAKLEMELC